MPEQLAQLEKLIAEASNVSVEDIRGRKRLKEFADARAVIWYIARTHLGLRYTAIAYYYERDHTTVISGVQRMKDNPVVHEIVGKIKTHNADLLKPDMDPRRPRTIERWRFPTVEKPVENSVTGRG